MTLFVDSVSKKIFLEFQQTTKASETIESKHRVERKAFHSGVKVKRYCADNGVFKAGTFRLDLDQQNQEITYCGVGAHHQNGIAERHIRTMVEKARTVLLNAHARNDMKIPMELWTFAMRHVATQ